uniref:Uncharacterized protein n=1 Tax=Pipistrellus kuhlii TaxID=59472 RepID=A0A7J7W3J3_PIPKU|nr:hypothetical protein mPipKuh1_008159 [Pipistrellus kuhlii]
MTALDPRDGAVPSLLGTDPLSSALLPLRTAAAKAMSTSPLPALSPSGWACRADTGLSGPGAPLWDVTLALFEWPTLGLPPFLSPIWKAQNQTAWEEDTSRGGGGGDKPRIVPGPLRPKHNLDHCRSHSFSKSDARKP